MSHKQQSTARKSKRSRVRLTKQQLADIGELEQSYLQALWVNSILTTKLTELGINVNEYIKEKHEEAKLAASEKSIVTNDKPNGITAS